MGVARIAGQHLWWARAGPVARKAAIVGAGTAEVDHRTGNEMQRKIKMKARRLALPRGSLLIEVFQMVTEFFGEIDHH